MFVTTQEQTELFRFYDKNQDGQISVSEFLQSLEDQLPDRRLNAVKAAFQYLDNKSAGFLDLDFLRQNFVAANHPRVVTREKTVEQVTSEFQAALTRYSSQGRMSESEFLAYYSSLSATIPAENDEYFSALLVGCWAVNTSRDYISPQRLGSIEDTFYEKIRQKTKPSEDEGKVLVRLFRFFDNKGTGGVGIREFQGALERLGCTFTQAEITALFNKYNPTGTGKVLYENLSSIFAIKGAGNNSQFTSARDVPYAVLDKIKKELLRRGTHGIRGLSLVMKRIDLNKSGDLDRQEFEWGLRENGHQLSGLDLDRLFKYFDKNNDGNVSYDEFLRAIRGDLSEARKQVIEAAFKKLDVTGDGVVNLEDVKQLYDVSFHPDFRSGKKTRDQILLDFMGQWDTIKKDGTVTLDEFIDYYVDVSASVDRDDVFVAMVSRAWNLN